MAIRRRKLKNGKTVYSVITEEGRIDGKRSRSCRTYKTLKEARRAESEALVTRDALRDGSGVVTLSAYIERVYWPNAKKRLAPTSLDTYRIEIDKRILPALGNRRLMDIDRPAIQKMIGKCKTKSVGMKCLGVIRAILNDAMADNLIASNPASMRITVPKRTGKRDNGVVVGTFDQIREITDSVSRDAEPIVARMVYLGLWQGLRPEERYALQWDDIDETRNTIAIRRAFVAVSGKHGGNQPKKPKTEQSARVIPMHPEFARFLKTQERASGTFVTDGRMLSPSTARHKWQRYLLEHDDLPWVTLENMRHSFATAYLEAGGRVETLSRILGHSNIATTYKRYVRPDLDAMREDMANLGKK